MADELAIFHNNDYANPLLGAKMRMTRAHLAVLEAIEEAGGGAVYDAVSGNVCAGTPRQAIAQAGAVLVLVAHGLVAGERGRLILTQEGREAVSGLRAGREARTGA
jgi:hypothetical protein